MFINREFEAVIRRIQEKDPRYDRGAYYFVRQGLDHTITRLEKLGKKRDSNHVSGGELLEGIREFALQQYGPMALTLLKTWGVNDCKDIGHIVFHLVDNQVLGKTEKDTIEDFECGYDFDEAFNKPFLPRRN